ncbi:protein arginine methyltransferase NDUFAF7, mitochondrial isoform X2 [Etheostoma spectabile]|uniref:protein arginine methyltransferase NDUFAF7, mitochondrial isoform X2 n=1 Tax=Etheostoma spectabile TaxID=54343 RepID=UPI0013AF73A8|nr:protein arginine methyltransferase NDUFAF7, mitochondrial-like isoform X2 [Etheostoma spectabile]
MREVLTNPVTGYYYVRINMLGPDGDLTTSSEISQIFGELLGVWVVSEWTEPVDPNSWSSSDLGKDRWPATSSGCSVSCGPCWAGPPCPSTWCR